MALLQRLAGNEGLQHPPPGLGDVARRLADYAHFGTEEAQRLEVVHHEDCDVFGYPQAEILDGRNDALAGNVARREKGARPVGAAQNLEGRQPDFLRVED